MSEQSLYDLDDFPVPAMSPKDIERHAASRRSGLPSPLEPAPNVISLARHFGRQLERQFAVVSVPDQQMGRAYAYVSKDGARLLLRQSVTDAANEGDPSSRFIVVHEFGHIDLGHATLHKRPMHRMVGGNIKVKHIVDNESAELQANSWARTFLMPKEIVVAVASPEELAEICRVPLNHARHRYRDVREFLSGPRKALDVVETFLASHKSQTGRRTSASQAAWDKALEIPGEDPNQFRQTRTGYRIQRADYERRTEMGWFVLNGEAISEFEYRNR